MPSDYHSYPDYYRQALAFSDILYQLNHRRFLRFAVQSLLMLGIQLAYHVPPFKFVDLAACSRPGSCGDRETANPLAVYPLPIPRIQPLSVVLHLTIFRHRFRCLQHINSQRSSGLWLPEGESSHDSSPTPYGVSLLCPPRSLFRGVGSSSDIDGYLLFLLLSFLVITTIQATFVSHGVP